jgi:hypothetical protein
MVSWQECVQGESRHALKQQARFRAPACSFHNTAFSWERRHSLRPALIPSEGSSHPQDLFTLLWAPPLQGSTISIQPHWGPRYELSEDTQAASQPQLSCMWTSSARILSPQALPFCPEERKEESCGRGQCGALTWASLPGQGSGTEPWEHQQWPLPGTSPGCALVVASGPWLLSVQRDTFLPWFSCPAVDSLHCCLLSSPMSPPSSSGIHVMFIGWTNAGWRLFFQPVFKLKCFVLNCDSLHAYIEALAPTVMVSGN